MTFGELVDRVIEVTGSAPEDTAKVASELYGAERAYTKAGIRHAPEKLGPAARSRCSRRSEPPSRR